MNDGWNYFAILAIGSTILNAGISGRNIANLFGIIGSGSNLCSDDGSGLLIAPGDQIITDPMIGPFEAMVALTP